MKPETSQPDAAGLKEKIMELERGLDDLRNKKPVHDTTGSYLAQKLELEDELSDLRKLLIEAGVRMERKDVS